MFCNFKKIVMLVVYTIISIFFPVLAKSAVKDSFGIKELKRRRSCCLIFDITSFNRAP